MTFTVIPVSLAQANAFVDQHHRHHTSLRFHKYSIGAAKHQKLVGVCIVNRPVNLSMDDGITLEVARLCTDGTPNACSFLLSRAARAAKALGYRRIQTYTLAEEVMKSRGASLWGAGWLCLTYRKAVHGTTLHEAAPTTTLSATNSAGSRNCLDRKIVPCPRRRGSSSRNTAPQFPLIQFSPWLFVSLTLSLPRLTVVYGQPAPA
jgi:hypothetical protein